MYNEAMCLYKNQKYQIDNNNLKKAEIFATYINEIRKQYNNLRRKNINNYIRASFRCIYL